VSDGLLPELTPRTLPPFSYVAPATLSDAISLLAKYGSKAKVMAGGSDLLYMMKRDAMPSPPEVVIDIKNVAGLGQLAFDPTAGLSMGSLVTVGDIESSDVISENYPLLSQVSGEISSPQVRNVATVGGALAQQVWCPFLRNALRCWRAGGSICYATQPGADNRYYMSVMGGDDCYAAHPSDLAVALEALDASVVVDGGYGTKTVPLAEFLPGNVWVGGVLQSHILLPTELVTAVTIPPSPQGLLSTFVKSKIRNAVDFGIASVAVTLTMDGGTVEDSRVVFGGIAPAPYRDSAVEAVLNGSILSSVAPDQAAGPALSAATPLENNAYQVDVAIGVLMEAVEELSAQG
jgi:xanthine dehydrogenase YagS FAD-binding subunit